MELGCGTGLVTALLAPNMGHLVAVDGWQACWTSCVANYTS